MEVADFIVVRKGQDVRLGYPLDQPEDFESEIKRLSQHL